MPEAKFWAAMFRLCSKRESSGIFLEKIVVFRKKTCYYYYNVLNYDRACRAKALQG